ncbi:fungal-specific transcription factor domain-containing protein [Xylariaceae sp. FL0804]|nr:fungal-specific transcription factor domain-containing protein [Xylariaceae sp. FL0804]
MSTSSTAASQPATKSGRVLACAHCQYRKVKCDRNFPCANCIKSKVACTPSTPAVPQRRRRPNQALLERLARCEELLRQYGHVGDSPPSHLRQLQLKDRTAQSDPGSSDTGRSTPADPFGDPADTSRTTGQIVEHGRNFYYMDNVLWASFHDELQAMREILGPVEDTESEGTAAEHLTPESTGDLFLPTDPYVVETRELQPDPAHAFRLWHFFLERVNPLTKLIHVPTLQPVVVEAAVDIGRVPLNYQALLFAIYTMAVVSLTEAECLQTLGVARDSALHQFTSGCKVSLVRFNYLKNHDMTILQTLVLFMLSLHNRVDRHALWIMSGNVVRMAQKMGYHCDGEELNLHPFETEMRRRIWWQIIIWDAKAAMLSGLSHALVPFFRDTKIPLNLNDADLFPNSTEPVREREGPTEMAFCLMVYHFHKLVRSTHKTFDPAFAALQKHGGDEDTPEDQRNRAECRALLARLDSDLREIEEKYVDEVAGNVQLAALIVRPQLVNRMGLMLIPMREHPEFGTEILTPQDSIFKALVRQHEYNESTYRRLEATGYTWFLKLQMQPDVWIMFAGRLCRRPTGPLADRGWRVIQSTFAWHEEMLDPAKRQYAAQRQLTLRAWAAREQAFAQAGQPLETPDFIARLRECSPLAPDPDPVPAPGPGPGLVPPAEAQSGGLPAPSSSAVDPQQLPLGLGGGDLNQYMRGVGDLDASNVGWGMWAPSWEDLGVAQHPELTPSTSENTPYDGVDVGLMTGMMNLGNHER